MVNRPHIITKNQHNNNNEKEEEKNSGRRDGLTVYPRRPRWEPFSELVLSHQDLPVHNNCREELPVRNNCRGELPVQYYYLLEPLRRTANNVIPWYTEDHRRIFDLFGLGPWE